MVRGPLGAERQPFRRAISPAVVRLDVQLCGPTRKRVKRPCEWSLFIPRVSLRIGTARSESLRFSEGTRRMGSTFLVVCFGQQARCL